MAKQVIIIVFVLCGCAWQAHAAVNCTASGAGRHADPNDTTCQNYTLCVYVGSTNSYISNNYVCPPTSFFSPTLGQCTSNYTCTATSTTTNSTASCTADGFFADPESAKCSSYILCVRIDGTYVKTTYTCPVSTFYNPNTTLCDPSYTCTFTCTAAGRYPNTADTTCQKYYYCVLLGNGTYVRYEYTCPSTSMFNPSSAQCTASYKCAKPVVKPKPPKPKPRV